MGKQSKCGSVEEWNKENVMCTYNGMLFSLKNERNPVIRDMDEP